MNIKVSRECHSQNQRLGKNEKFSNRENLGTICILQSFVRKTIHCESTSHNCHTELPCEHSELYKPQSALQLVRYQDSLPDSNFNSSLFPRLVHNALYTFLAFNDFIWCLAIYKGGSAGPEFISISSSKMRRVIKLRVWSIWGFPQNFCRFQVS